MENRAVFLALGVNLEGHKEVLGLWTGATVQLCIVHLVRNSLNFVSWKEHSFWRWT